LAQQRLGAIEVAEVELGGSDRREELGACGRLILQFGPDASGSFVKEVADCGLVLPIPWTDDTAARTLGLISSFRLRPGREN
jgi:hypothetical protein